MVMRPFAQRFHIDVFTCAFKERKKDVYKHILIDVCDNFRVGK